MTIFYKLILFLCILNLYHSIYQCPKFKCTYSSKPIANSTFISFEIVTNTINLYNCPNYQSNFIEDRVQLLLNYSRSKDKEIYNCMTFPLQLYGGIEVDNSPRTFGVEGDYCVDKNDCSSNICESYVCKGDDINQCTNTTLCSSNNYCNLTSFKCSPRKENDETCESDDNCLNTSGCYNKVCTSLFSFPAGKKLNTTEPREKAARFCISNWTNENYTCEDLINDGISPFLCKSGEVECSYLSSITFQSVTIKDSCNCDIMSSNSFCRYGTNTIEWLTYINAVLNNWYYPCHYYNKGYCTKVPMLSNYYLFNSTLALYGINGLNSNLLACLAPPTYPLDIGYCQDYLGHRCTSRTAINHSELLKLTLYKLLGLIIIIFI